MFCRDVIMILFHLLEGCFSQQQKMFVTSSSSFSDLKLLSFTVLAVKDGVFSAD